MQCQERYCSRVLNNLETLTFSQQRLLGLLAGLSFVNTIFWAMPEMDDGHTAWAFRLPLSLTLTLLAASACIGYYLKFYKFTVLMLLIRSITRCVPLFSVRNFVC
jgi:hypothetical protein